MQIVFKLKFARLQPTILLSTIMRSPATNFIRKIDSIIWSFCLHHVCKTVYLIRARKLNPHCVKVTPSQDLGS